MLNRIHTVYFEPRLQTSCSIFSTSDVIFTNTNAFAQWPGVSRSSSGRPGAIDWNQGACVGLTHCPSGNLK